MKRLLIIALITLLPGCSVTLYGQQSTSGGSASTVTGSSVRGSTQIGNARIGGSFGTPPAANAPGGQVSFSRGASAVLVLGLAIAGAGEVVRGWMGAPEKREPLTADGISHTCSCYGWEPGLPVAPPPQ